MQEFLQGINKHDLSRASVTHTESTIRQQTLSNALATDSDSRIVIYSHPPFNNWVFAASRQGLLSQAGPYGSQETLLPPGTDQPGPGILAAATAGESLYIFDQTALWRQDGNGFARIMALPATGLRTATDGTITLFAAGASLYRIAAGGGPAQLLQLPAVPSALAVFSNSWAAGFADGRLYLGRDGQLSATVLVPAPLTALALDPDGVWIGTARAGLYRLQAGKLDLRLDRGRGLPDNTITALSLLPDGVAIGTARGGLVSYFPQSGDIVLHTPHPWRVSPARPSPFSDALAGSPLRLRLRILFTSGIPGAHLSLDSALLGTGIPAAVVLAATSWSWPENGVCRFCRMPCLCSTRIIPSWEAAFDPFQKTAPGSPDRQIHPPVVVVVGGGVRPPFLYHPPRTGSLKTPDVPSFLELKDSSEDCWA
jgi:hypothetical protein